MDTTTKSSLIKLKDGILTAAAEICCVRHGGGTMLFKVLYRKEGRFSSVATVEKYNGQSYLQGEMQECKEECGSG